MSQFLEVENKCPFTLDIPEVPFYTKKVGNTRQSYNLEPLLYYIVNNDRETLLCPATRTIFTDWEIAEITSLANKWNITANKTKHHPELGEELINSKNTIDQCVWEIIDAIQNYEENYNDIGDVEMSLYMFRYIVQSFNETTIPIFIENYQFIRRINKIEADEIINLTLNTISQDKNTILTEYFAHFFMGLANFFFTQ